MREQSGHWERQHKFRKKTVTSLSLLLLIQLLAIFFPPIAVAATTIFYIQPDGTVFPSTRLLQRESDTYTFTDDISGSIIVQKDNVRIDGNSYTLQGGGNGTGIDLTNRFDVELTNVRINFFSDGIRLDNSNSNLVEKNEISYTTVGIHIVNSKDNIVTDNNVFFNIFGIELRDSDDNAITYNKVTKNFHGITSNFSNNNTVSGNEASFNNVWGMSFNSSEHSTINSNNVSNNDEGFSLAHLQSCKLENNIVNSNNVHGISLGHSQGNKLSHNKAHSNKAYGLVISSSSKTSLEGNSLSNSTYNFKLTGSLSSHFDNSIGVSNTVNNKTILYLVNVADRIYDASTNAGTVYVINGTYVTLKDLVLQKNEYGLFMWNTKYSQVENVEASGNNYGMVLLNSENNLVALNRITGNNAGVKLEYSNKTLLRNNEVLSNQGWGIQLDSTSANTVFSNNVTSNNRGILLYRCTKTILTANLVSNNFDGIVTTYTNVSTLIFNRVESNGWHGIFLNRAHQNRVCENNITKSLIGIILEQSSDNLIFHNNFIDNTKQAKESSDNVNYWDNGYADGGNYWSDQVKTDLYTTAFQNETGSDGIVDSPYVINEHNRDRYPLMYPWHGQLPLPILRVEPSVYNISFAGEVFRINVSLSDLDMYWHLSYVELKLRYNNKALKVLDVFDGTFMKHFADQYPASSSEDPDSTIYSFMFSIEPHYIHVVVRINHPQIDSRHYPEGNGALAVITFQAITSAPTRGDLEIAETTLYEELNRGNQIPHYTESGQYRILIGDLNEDGKVDMSDLGRAASSFGSYPEHPRWNMKADINQDSRVDIRDIALIASNFGRSWA